MTFTSLKSILLTQDPPPFQAKFGRSMSSISLPSIRLPSGAKFWKKRSANISEYDPTFEKSNHLETVRATHERECADEVRHIVTANKADLSEIELQVIAHRFGVAGGALGVEADAAAANLTLEQVGQVIGVTKERVRQIQNKALEKLRAALAEASPESSREMAEDIAAREGRPVPAASSAN